MADVELKLDGLENLLKALKQPRPPRVRIGILGDGARADQEGGPTNATIGAAHEFGTSSVPMRSFLRVPLAEHLNKRLAASGLLDKKAMRDVIASGSLVPWLYKVAVIGEGIVQEAFDSGGFGKWPELKEETLHRKKVHQILVETTQLRNSITSEVVDE